MIVTGVRDLFSSEVDEVASAVVANANDVITAVRYLILVDVVV